MLTRLRSQLPSWRRALRRRRRLLALLALALATAAMLPSLLPPSVRGVEVVVVREPIPAGTELAPEHLRSVRVAAELVPDDAAVAPEDLLGRTTALPLTAGTPLLPGMLEGTADMAVPDGAVLMVVPVPDVLAPQLRPGRDLELLAPDPMTGGSGRVAAQLIALADDPEASGALGTAAPGTVPALVAVDRSRAGEVAHALGAASLVVAVIG
ncbi:SAF domain-containing protein [Brachybacterium sp. AOP43-C2-M15]|uniref:SAF domain-containing protein n=1 Tax=Brachybacterium sp. AOP43-C2-M15 TaxID=3457661 RepID=UPI004033D365